MSASAVLLRLLSRRPAVPFPVPLGKGQASRPRHASSRPPKEETGPPAAEKLDLDGWKEAARGDGRGEVPRTAPGGREDAAAAATREFIEMWRLLGKEVPEHISEEQFHAVLRCPSKSAKKKYLKFLFTKEKRKKADRARKERKRAAREEEAEGSEDAEHGPKNTFLRRIYQKAMEVQWGWRAAQAMTFGQPLLFDMAYEHVMTRVELENAVRQLLESEGWNRRAADPFHIYFCNLRPGGAYHRELVERYGGKWDRLLLTATDKPPVDLFPRSDLVYLTADSPNVMTAFRPDRAYVVGSLVDRNIQKGLSFAHAKRMNVATERLPLDRYLNWDAGGKNLTLDQVTRILMSVKDSGNWEEALRFVPRRKHSGFVDASAYPRELLDGLRKPRAKAGAPRGQRRGKTAGL
ncbi:tRNA methyltransferase 10 homolog C [Tachyglossus aculeatus]|uniref:tRNA methyltransferase 10 homolog C n=1 Tax=Tachyglossus aculeatus TaxID=9261 RepID=UPI0018F4458D|nr:tRNA methyltransferase 10 homolog C [Tachyglossus aculeatus]